jgi:methylated-DNA-protein-cysteine methyltransferase-like protein
MMSNEPGGKQRVWQVVALIPTGQVSTYGEIAEMAGLGRGARQVGGIMSRLPQDTSLPWHRVINASGRISLPVGSPGYFEQRRRLEDEGVVFIKGRVSFANHRWRP